jgi:putative membrane protein
VGLISLAIYFPLDRRLPALHSLSSATTTPRILLGVGLYYGVLAFNLAMTFWIGESFMALSGLLMHLPVPILLASRICVTSQRPVAS